MAIEAKLKIVKHKLYTLHNEYVKLYSEKKKKKKKTHTHTHTTWTSSISTFASGKSSTSEWLTVNEKKMKVWKLRRIVKLNQTWSQML
ncbi:hypothetical protein JHK82_051084 [Glycine max]|nr:hypothetical protein JHK82_051084 [Glycine max]